MDVSPSFVTIPLPRFSVNLTVHESLWQENVESVKSGILPPGKFQNAYFETWTGANAQLRGEITQLANLWGIHRQTRGASQSSVLAFLSDALPDEHAMTIRAYAILNAGFDKDIVYEAFVDAWISLRYFLNFNTWILPDGVKPN